MKIIKALENYSKNENDTVIFLAGSCSGTNKNWRNEVIKFLENIENDKTLSLDNLVIIDPFRKDWPKTEDGIKEQVDWENSMAEQCDIFSCYFDKNKNSVSPISLYETGKYLMLIKSKFSNVKLNYRLILSAHPDYDLFNIVSYQIAHATKNWKTHIELVSTEKNIMVHASRILEAYIKISK
jgi:hypothetical protein